MDARWAGPPCRGEGNPGVARSIRSLLCAEGEKATLLAELARIAQQQAERSGGGEREIDEKAAVVLPEKTPAQSRKVAALHAEIERTASRHERHQLARLRRKVVVTDLSDGMSEL
ncbi:hypothetical protein [Microbacterium amylolyticum]|uniref:Uncharacterized protein n=1 Tax=Microbacterium amylolyticum TaxID=936337 RepID=A0ABS4ZGR4_9MICO|nr:hypothetical protein [Microbacterium amylolyticum]MBP2436459.1 hypothetical protein [Microbacterium amylolyticum]